MALCLKKSIRASDYVGRLGRSGFLVVLRNINMKQAEDKHQRMVDNFDIGFSGMINNVITMKSCVYNASLSSQLDDVLDGLKNQQVNLY
jgi:GGDEF domain-containing protein